MSKDDNMKVCRDKYWNELDNEQKIERMREAVKTVRRAQTTLHRKVDMLMEHEHVANQLFSPVSSKRSSTEYDPIRGDEYF